MWLNDNHNMCTITAEHQYDGLQCTGLQETKFLKPLPADTLQILHTNGNHWIAAATGELHYRGYNCLWLARLSPDTEILLTWLVNTDKFVVSVNIDDVTNQSGPSDCGLFPVAYIIHTLYFNSFLVCMRLSKVLWENISWNVWKTRKCNHFQWKKKEDCPHHIKLLVYKYTISAVALMMVRISYIIWYQKCERWQRWLPLPRQPNTHTWSMSLIILQWWWITNQ